MAEPPVPPKRALPFKRTAKRKSIETPVAKSDAQAEDVFSSLFEHDRKKNYFEESERRATEKAAKLEKERRENLRKEDKDAREQLLRESAESKASGKKRHESELRDPKRRRGSPFDGNDEDLKLSSHSESRKSSHITPKSANKSHGSRSIKGESARAREIISLDDTDDDDYKPHPTSSRKGKEKMRAYMVAEDDDVEDTLLPPPLGNLDPIQIAEEDSEEDSEEDDEMSQLTAKYVREAEQRMANRKAERLAREANPGSGPSTINDDAAAEILVDSRVEGIPIMKIKIQVTKRMELVRDAWVAKTLKRGTPVRDSVVESMFFTWKGNKIYNFTTLASMGIRPDSKGNLLPTWETSKEGYMGYDKVYVEAWTQDLYEEHQRERKRKRSGLVDEPEEESEPEPEPVKEVRIQVILKSKDYGEQGLKVPPNCPVRNIVRAFRSMKKIPKDKHIEIQFDGEMLEESSTIDVPGIEEMDSVDVYVR
ncbi:hypothetical protein BJ170DRAFT_677277 [Xylariales sp. AK1849]|nr:hypothetical protein BJ170DRAFT_677277 [Xylariales sp. AK1849]